MSRAVFVIGAAPISGRCAPMSGDAGAYTVEPPQQPASTRLLSAISPSARYAEDERVRRLLDDVTDAWTQSGIEAVHRKTAGVFIASCDLSAAPWAGSSSIAELAERITESFGGWQLPVAVTDTCDPNQVAMDLAIQSVQDGELEVAVAAFPARVFGENPISEYTDAQHDLLANPAVTTIVLASEGFVQRHLSGPLPGQLTVGSRPRIVSLCETASQKVRMAEDRWNTRDRQRVVLG